MRVTRQQTKARMESPTAMGKGNANPEAEVPEEEEEESPVEGALVAVDSAAEVVEITVLIAKSKLHCPLCTLPLKPPIFQCAFGHLVCGVCHPQLRINEPCYACGHAGDYARSNAMEDFVGSAKVPCPYDEFGCRSYVTYHRAAEHQRACPHAPCLCTEPGCGEFAGSPGALRDHLRDAHAWPVDSIRYGAALQLHVAGSDPAQHRRLLAAGDDEGGAVFCLAVGALGGDAPAPAPLRVVSLVCARPSGAAAAGPRYACTMRAAAPAGAEWVGKAESAVLKVEVPSSAAPGETTMEEAASLVVMRRMLHGAAADEVHLSVRIDKIV